MSSIREITTVIPITVLTKEVRLNYNTLSKRLLDPRTLTVADVCNISQFLQIDPAILFNFIRTEILAFKRPITQTG